MTRRAYFKSLPEATKEGAGVIARLCACLCSVVLAISLCAATTGAAQQANQSGQSESKPPAASKGSSALVSPDEDYRIGPGDVIEIQIEDAPELSRNFRISAAATFLMFSSVA